MTSQAGKTALVISNRSVLVYQKKDGMIVHRHDHTTFEGSAIADEHHLEKRALEHATRRGHVAADLAVLHIKTDALKHGAHYKVDPSSKQLSELATPKR
jgi:hypothetical protein